jgi:hypothetical protein
MYSSHINHELARAKAYRLAPAARPARPTRRRRPAILAAPIRMFAGTAILCGGLTATAILAGPALADGAAPAYVTFDKHALGPDYPGQFAGTTGGAAPGTVHTTCNLTPLNETLYQVTCDWQISAGQHSFDAPLTGTLNWQTGDVVMNGRIASGWQAGHQVHETGHLVDPAVLEFAGTIQIQP